MLNLFKMLDDEYYQIPEKIKEKPLDTECIDEKLRFIVFPREAYFMEIVEYNYDAQEMSQEELLSLQPITTVSLYDKNKIFLRNMDIPIEYHTIHFWLIEHGFYFHESI